MFDGYLWAKTLHIVLIASWFAGLFYLPRIFVNLAQETNDVAYERLIGMAQRLYRFMTILMMPAVALGLILWLYYGVGRGSIWMHVKVLLVLIVIGYHLQCKHLLKQFVQKQNTKSHVWYRWFNEAPVLLMLVVTALVVIKPN
ncbi:MAG: CopD family protein [Polynucleobacter sp.]|jgi:putative membrane protein